MSEPKYLEVATTEQPELEKGESGLSSANVATEARESRQSESAQTGVNLTNLRGVATGNTEERSLRVTRETPSGVYVHRDGAGEGFSRSVDDKKQIVNMILVNEVKKLIAMSDAELKAYFDKLIEDVRKGQYVEVDTTEYPTLEDFLESTGEQGTVYLYPVGNSANNYYQYIWENGVWMSLGSTELDLKDIVRTLEIASTYATSGTVDSEKLQKINSDQYIDILKVGDIYFTKKQTGRYFAADRISGEVHVYTLDIDLTTGEWTIVDETMIDADSDQTIRGVKNFENNSLTFDNQTRKYLVEWQDNSLRFRRSDMTSSQSTLRLNGYSLITYRIQPITNGAEDLGVSSYKWRDLYLSGKIKDGTNEFNADNVFNVINASDITDNILTEAQYALITNGKPTLIKGTILGYTDLFLTGMFLRGGNPYFRFSAGVGTSNGAQGLVMVLATTKVINVPSDNYDSLANVGYVNNKLIPAFPTSNTEKQVVVIAPNGGALSWEDPFKPASVAVADGGTISDDTLKELIIGHYPIVLNGYTGYYSCDDGTNYQYASTMYDASTNSIHYNVITINKSTWVVTFHTKNIAL